MSLLPNDLLRYAYYTCIPDIYREEDASVGYPLYRYLSSIILGGYSLQIEDIENLITLVDPESCPEEFFPFLYESFGLEFYPDVDVKYQRRFLMNFGELRKRRGTYSSIRFLVKSLTGLEVSFKYLRGVWEGSNGRHLIITLLADSVEELINIDTSVKVINNFLSMFVPYYITTWINSEIAKKDVDSTVYSGCCITQRVSYKIGF